jgi:tail fiber protein gp53
MPTNFIQFNPGQANQETDSAYAADSQRAGGAASGAVFPSPLANKLFYQTSTGIAALMQALSNKGYTTNDTNFAALVAVLSNIQTAADGRTALVGLTFSPVQNLNFSVALGYSFTLNSNVTVNFSGGQPGDLLTLIVGQDTVGGRLLTFPVNVFGAPQPNPIPTDETIYLFKVDLTGNYVCVGASDGSGNMLALGLLNVPISQTGTPQPANFATPATADNSNKAATTAFVRALLSSTSGAGLTFVIGPPGYVIFPFGLIIQWGFASSSTGGSGSHIAFPLAFPNAVLAVIPNPTGTNSANYDYTNGVSTSGFTLINDGTGPAAYWIAIGF